MRFSVFSCMIPDLTPEQALPALAQHGYDAICWRVTDTDPARRSEAPSFWGNNLCTLSLKNIQAEADRVKPLAKAAGIANASLTTYLNLSDLDLGMLENVLKAAQSIGAAQVRVNAPAFDGKTSVQELLELGRKRLAEAAGRAGHYGCRIVIEIHMGLVTPSAALALSLVEDIDPKTVGVIYDPGNMVVEGMENPKISLDLLGPYLAAVHVKNTGWYPKPEGGWRFEFIPIDQGIVDWKGTMRLLQERNFDGLVSFEDFSSLGTAEKLPKNIRYIKSALA
jgi:sugar phosphate isomerase/epimerase